MTTYPIAQTLDHIAQAVLADLAQGMSQKAAASKHGIHRRTVARILARSKATEQSKDLGTDRLFSRGKTVATLKTLTPQLLKAVKVAVKAAQSNPEFLKQVDQGMRAAHAAEKMSASAASDGLKKDAPTDNRLTVVIAPGWGPQGVKATVIDLPAKVLPTHQESQ